MAKTVYLVRHGSTSMNALSLMQGRVDVPLSAEGIKQAEGVKNYFQEKGIVFDHAYSSTLQRAVETLKIITGIPFTELSGLCERDYGTMDGKSSKLMPMPPMGDYFVKFGGESDDQAFGRLDSTIRSIMDKEDHENVLVVTHGAALKLLMARWDNQEEAYHSLPNCSVVKYRYDNGMFKLVSIHKPDVRDGLYYIE